MDGIALSYLHRIVPCDSNYFIANVSLQRCCSVKNVYILQIIYSECLKGLDSE